MIENIDRIRAVFFDIDGTLYSDKYDYTNQALSLRVDTYFVTGRNYETTKDAFKGINKGVFGYGSYIITNKCTKVHYIRGSKSVYKISGDKLQIPQKNERHIGEDGLYHIVSKKANKLSGVKYICKKHGYKRNEILVVGNAKEDNEMLLYYPNSIAVKGSEPNTIECAKYNLDIKEVLAMLR